MGEYEEIFKFAAKAGALEGYLYEREKVEPLQDWVANIEAMYQNLPGNVKEDIKEEFGNVLKRTLNNGQKVLDKELVAKLDALR